MLCFTVVLLRVLASNFTTTALLIACLPSRKTRPQQSTLTLFYGVGL